MTPDAGLRPTIAEATRMLRPFLPAAVLFTTAALAGFVTMRGAPAARHEPLPALAAAAPLLALAPPPVVPFTAPVRVVTPLEPEAPASPPAPPPAPRTVNVGRIPAGGTLATALRAKGVSAGAVHVIATEMAPVFNFRYARAGDRFHLEQGEDGTVLAFRYVRSPLERYDLEKTAEGYVAARHQPDLVRARTRLAGIVSTSLYQAVEALGERAELGSDFANIFAWDVDFSRGVQQGDAFSIVYERLHIAGEDGEEETYIRPGRILAARYTTRGDEFRALYFQQDERRGGYYRPDGSAVERQFLRAPLQFTRISSAFSLSRLHPILNVRRPHPGIDYAAPTGTPVWAVADGEVIYRARAGGFGKLVKIRHNNGYVSYYGHLSRFDAAARVGTRVGQKQVIGYVGATGLATGPHLDYRLRKNGRFVNPATLRTPAGDPIAPELMPRFATVRDELLSVLDPPTLVVVSEAL